MTDYLKAFGKPEHQLLLLCSRINVDSKTEAAIKQIAHSSLNWDMLVSEALSHQVLPLLYHNLNNLCPDVLPKELRHKVTENIKFRTNRNLLLYKSLQEVLKLFQKHNVTVVSLKGSLLSQLIYGNLTLRSFGDLDLLIHERDYEKAYELLKTLGYKRGKAGFKYTYHWYFFNDNLNIPLELHWEIAEKFLSIPLSLKTFENHYSLQVINGLPVNALSVESNLLYLSIHGAKHRWLELKLLADIAALLKKYPIDWSITFALAKSTDCQRILLLALLLVHELFEVPLPETITRKFSQDTKLVSLKRRVYRKLINASPPKNYFDSLLDQFRTYFFYLDIREGHWKKSRILKLIVTQTIESQVQRVKKFYKNLLTQTN